MRLRFTIDADVQRLDVLCNNNMQVTISEAMGSGIKVVQSVEF